MIQSFLQQVTSTHKTGAATEHSYRPALQALFQSLSNDITAINEPRRVACGAPDFIIQRGELAVGHVEAKDLHIGLRNLKDANKAQQDRYRKALPNLIYTNCLDWDFYRNGELFASVTIADYLMGIQPNKDQFGVLENLLRDFISQRPQSISSPEVLANMMAGKAQLIKDVFANTLNADDGSTSELYGHCQAFKQQLIHDISIADFADLYAETIAYGMFAARLHDDTPEDFSRQEALHLLPKSNPFLRSLFGFIAGVDLDERIAWVIDDLAAVFQAADVKQIMQGFGELTGRQDPFLHFYETFLSAYNPDKRKSRGVWYTPEAVVNFIVRAVDEVLQTEFGLADGLADTSKITIDWDTDLNDKKGQAITQKKDVHRVQILDPATGTGTFLAEVVKHIAPKIKSIAPSMWTPYIEQDLIPRLHGFELLMASYGMCHMKLDMILTELGYQPGSNPPRLGVYLTNSLEEGEREVQDLFMAQWLTREAREASDIKRKNPIMCILGNPPYAGESSNKGEWIMDLMDAYKKEPGGKQKLQERNPKWLNDDYVKFIRMSEHLISQNGEGVLGFITNHGYLDNPTFRGMRWHLMHSFDKIYLLDLHGNSKKKEVTPEGKPDTNVFDIQQGVSIIIAIKHKRDTGKKAPAKPLAQVFHGDLWGRREDKYQALFDSSLASFDWQHIQPQEPQFAFIPRNYALEEQYQQGFAVHEFMPVNSVGIVTARDALTIDSDKNHLWQRVQDFAQLPPEEARLKYKLGKDVRDWQVAWAQDDVRDNLDISKVVPIAYRPFDTRWTLYTGNSRGFLCYPRNDVMRHMLHDNLAMAVSKQHKASDGFYHVIAHIGISESSLTSNKTAEIGYSLPLYTYAMDAETQQLERQANFNSKLHRKLLRLAKHPEFGEPDELAIFDYIYAVLHCPAYRQTYAEFLKYDFPRIPWPASPDEFWRLREQGSQLRQLHLMQPTAIGDTPYPLLGDGDNCIDKPRLQNSQIWINKTQYFDQVPDGVWEFYIGGYQPAQKWLKDRKDLPLSFSELKHYQSILKILARTAEIMQGIELSGLE
ncbi:type ISP restriction/modification enzyme [Thiopseudomonas acetoxidans]|uniref:site-specific DNA-methyltransferase (adenine-specific) n=1 Tax=Thiopseudomonas acetoxidans TaxID=3041622 RepID=A0ABT7SL51_9GAMM|nr:type ISP restriction/modification enzyme [Thiopseudomonas sp. CY1220]MDM7856908.1 N-6 DNA methylase [Thiopseudomonas sp. CY1220]